MKKKVVYLELKGEEVISVQFKEDDKIQEKLYENKNLLIRIANKFGLIKIFWLSLGDY